MKQEAILVINAGSSSIKFAIFAIKKDLQKINYGMIDKVLIDPEITIYNTEKQIILNEKFGLIDYDTIVKNLIGSINNYLEDFTLIGVGHRVVHGGTNYLAPILINEQVIRELNKLIPLAPLHQPYNLKLITSIRKIYPDLKQVACFDTAFHASQSMLVRKFAIPEELANEGVIKYGFHGLSYEYIAGMIPNFFPQPVSMGKIIVAHLGNGSSVCALNQLKSVASSMGFTALEGLMMGTRCGNIDPGVVLYLLEQKKLTVQETTKLLYSGSGLLGVSGISSDVRTLEASNDIKAKQALELFCYRAAREMLALCTILQGLDGIVFTAGIGEHSIFIREKICNWLSWLGIELDDLANKKHADLITTPNSKITVAIIPTNEELMIAQHAQQLIS